MAVCPHCSYKLKPWNIKAECPSCGVNIPNYNWEERLEKDSVRSDIAFEKLHERTHNFKTTFAGNPLRIARLVLTFVPLVLLVLPLVNAQINLPFMQGEKTISILSMILWITGNSLDFGSLLSLMSGYTGHEFTLLFVSCALFLLSIVVAVINFFMLLIRSFGLGNIANIVCNALSFVLIIASGFVYTAFFSSLQATTVNFVTDTSLNVCIYIGAALFALNTIINILTECGIREERRQFHEKRAKSALISEK